MSYGYIQCWCWELSFAWAEKEIASVLMLTVLILVDVIVEFL